MSSNCGDGLPQRTGFEPRVTECPQTGDEQFPRAGKWASADGSANTIYIYRAPVSTPRCFGGATTCQLPFEAWRNDQRSEEDNDFELNRAKCEEPKCEWSTGYKDRVARHFKAISHIGEFSF